MMIETATAATVREIPVVVRLDHNNNNNNDYEYDDPHSSMAIIAISTTTTNTTAATTTEPPATNATTTTTTTTTTMNTTTNSTTTKMSDHFHHDDEDDDDYHQSYKSVTMDMNNNNKYNMKKQKRQRCQQQFNNCTINTTNNNNNNNNSKHSSNNNATNDVVSQVNEAQYNYYYSLPCTTIDGTVTTTTTTVTSLNQHYNNNNNNTNEPTTSSTSTSTTSTNNNNNNNTATIIDEWLQYYSEEDVCSGNNSSSSTNNHNNHNRDGTSYSNKNDDLVVNEENEQQQQQYQKQYMEYVIPDFNHWTYISLILLLCTSLAILSAYDAKIHCVQHEIYSNTILQLITTDDDDIVVYYNNYDANNNYYNNNNNEDVDMNNINNYYTSTTSSSNQTTMKCIHMFHNVVLPMCGGTAIASILTIIIMYLQHYLQKRRYRIQQQQQEQQQQLLVIPTTTTTATTVVQNDYININSTQQHQQQHKEDSNSNYKQQQLDTDGSMYNESSIVRQQHHQEHPIECEYDHPIPPTPSPLPPTTTTNYIPNYNMTHVISITVLLLLLYTIIFALQTYNVIAVMLLPRTDNDDDDDNNNNDPDDSNTNNYYHNNNNNNNNPYQSLAAVDQYGQVGDNANLYYLAWLSFGLSIALLYQVVTSTFRIIRYQIKNRNNLNVVNQTKQQQEQHSQYDPIAYSKKNRTNSYHSPKVRTVHQDNNHNPKGGLLRALSWDQSQQYYTNYNNKTPFTTTTTSSSYRKRRKILFDQSRAAWYSSLYRLRVRTGIWTAACISCWILVASSQYIWRQTIWPIYIQQQRNRFAYYKHHYYNYYNNNNNNNNNEDAEDNNKNNDGDNTNDASSSSSSVAAAAGVSENDNNSLLSYFSICHQTISYGSTDDYNATFTPQLCRRTLAAWVVGIVAAILCAAAIVMHVSARYFNKNHRTTGEHGSYRFPAKVVHAAVTVSQKQQQEQQNGLTTMNGTNAILQNIYTPNKDKSIHPPTVATSDYYDHDVIQLLANHTTEVWKNAVVSPSALLSRYYTHHHPNRLPLRTEIVLGILLSFLLGVNAVMVTGVEGPALKVGNLYYASWISFLLCLRICLGCIEEYFNVDDEDDEEDDNNSNNVIERQDTSQASDTSSKNKNAVRGNSDIHQTTSTYKAPKIDTRNSNDVDATNKNDFGVISPTIGDHGSVNSKDLATVSIDSTSSAAEKQEKKRIGRVRNYFFLSIFSTICGASSYDAASNQEKELTREQMYMMCAPCVVAVISYLLFGLSLSKRCYTMISKFWVGGLLSILSFGLLLGDLLLTMHSEDSWAVNNIGEISMANLYYFAWASIFTSGVQMSSYVKALFGINKLDHMMAMWVAICKVCFIILGASLHIWHTISDNCEFDEITLGAVTFCSRTVLAITVSLTGMLVGGLIVLGRIYIIFFPKHRCVQFQSHIEMLVSLFLVFLFVSAVALITGIGGPGQSVGDLYYSTWGAFWVSICIFVSCYHQLNEEEKEVVVKSESVLV